MNTFCIMPRQRPRPNAISHRRRHERPTPKRRSELDRDLAAMAKVWWMIRQGAVRMLGEIGRQY
ncbi:hypothetical protein [Synechococcus sp. HK01-R]|jgi:hypothetical protein|uniref:hypothetical protein n=2 Tax=unclassified Synechococcus TaxID=2626047 RepID=UPI001624602C|nr:hypothetical protein [Synechococcus sp. HK01-R]QNG25964.1 hypothetical protein H0O21_03280 [Synechococcus sp. HK01-R]